MDAMQSTSSDKDPEATEEEELETVPAPLDTDVLFGRDKIMFNHIGNVRFRLVIQSRAKEYEHAPSRRVKSSIVYSVVQNVHGYGGRFLKKEKDGTWKIVTVTEAIQKVGHALRDKKQHDHKMKAKFQANPGIPLLSAKNKSVEGGCDLLMKLGQVCAKEIAVSPKPGREAQESKKAHKSLPSAAKRSLPTAATQRPLKRPKSDTDEDSSVGEDEDDAVNAILALTGKKRPTPQETPSAPPVAAQAPVVHTHAPTAAAQAPQAASHARDIWHQLTRPSTASQHPQRENQKMAPPVTSQHPSLGGQHDSLFSIRNRAQQMAQQHLNQQPPRGPHPSMMQGRNNPQTMMPPAHLRALIQAQQMNTLMHAAAGVFPPHMGGFNFADPQGVAPPAAARAADSRASETTLLGVPPPRVAAPESNERNQNETHASEKPEPSTRPVTPPPVITDKKDDDGHWVFYPIKVPTLKLAGIKGWKLALIPADGKGTPIELDPSNIHLPPV